MKEQGKRKPGSSPDSETRTEETLREQGRSRREVSDIQKQMDGKQPSGKKTNSARKQMDGERRPKRYEEMNSTELLREALELGIENAHSMDAMQLEAAIRKARR